MQNILCTLQADSEAMQMNSIIHLPKFSYETILHIHCSTRMPQSSNTMIENFVGGTGALLSP